MNTFTVRTVRTIVIAIVASAAAIVVSLALSASSIARVLSAPLASPPVGVPETVGFEGYVVDASGDPIIDGTYSMTFRVYNAAEGGTQLWSEEQQNVELDNGFYVVDLGSSSSFSTDTFSGTRWIGVTFEGDPSEMTPRTKVSAVPFALTADTVDGKHADDIGVPIGAIMMWSGSPTSLPAGWALCDGQNGRPDLRGRFIVGYDPLQPDYDEIGGDGGEITHTLTISETPSHQHSVNPPSTNTSDAGAHSHTIRDGYPGTSAGIWTDENRQTSWNSGFTSTEPNHHHSVDIAAFDSAAAGGGEGHENRPPYYTLAFIIKVSE